MSGRLTDVDEPLDLVQRALLGDAVDRASALVFVADEQMRYVAVNQTACDALGYSRDELLQLRVTDVAVAPEAPGLFRDLVRAGAGRGETDLRRKDGALVRMRYSAAEGVVARMPVYVSVGRLD